MVQTKTALRMIMMMKLGQIEVLVAEKVRRVRKARGNLQLVRMRHTV